MSDLTAAPLAGPTLDLEPLRVEHAEELAPLLADPALHEFIGGEPETLAGLRARYIRQAVGRSPDGAQRWLNWVMRVRADRAPVGTVQATVTDDGLRAVAEVAWVVASAHQSKGHAKEGAATVASWLRGQAAVTIVAHIHPSHVASQGVARAIGLAPTDTLVDGELRWEG
ncbi:GNAT family N-acetyltransferase [uncultured Jatrophihabitans sp.]|uniref:GNAT family N-acetyltransferase n=1 Tax=uncultured Jatrophihabitans sp. TaxID=1610747 RepID=UPI0035CB8555